MAETGMPNRIDLDGRIAVVTGGAQGIGRAISERFLDSGAAVAIWDRDRRLSEKAVQELKARSWIVAFAADVADYANVEQARDETLARRGVRHFGRTRDLLMRHPRQWAGQPCEQ
jgi:3-oxoacyl-[acyl-carrier protein] reductase